jgi:hypothetical protein
MTPSAQATGGGPPGARRRRGGAQAGAHVREGRGPAVRERRAGDALGAGVDVDASAAGEAGEGHALILGQLDGERGWSPHADEDRRARYGGLLHELEREPPAHAQDPLVQGRRAAQQRPADDLVHRVVAADVLPHGDQLARGVEEARRVHAAAALERGLREAVGERRQQRAVDHRPVRRRRGLHRHLLQRPLAAHAAGGGGVEAPGRGGAQQRAGDFDGVGRHLTRERDGRSRLDQTLAEQEARRQLLVVARGAHRDRDRLAVDADLQWLLDRDVVVHAVVHDALERSAEICVAGRLACHRRLRGAIRRSGHQSQIPDPRPRNCLG